MLAAAAKFAFRALAVVGRPIGGVRPRRIYDIVGRMAWPRAAWRWYRNRWGDELWLSPHQHIDRCILAFGSYDPDLHCALEHLLRPGMVCLDVGANLGEVALHMARLVGAGGVVHAFEPASAPFARLRQHAEHNGNRVRCHQLALCDRSGTAQMIVPTEAAENQGLGTITDAQLPSEYARESVTLTTLDAFAAEHDLSRLDFIKLDIQGAEPALVRGGEKTIRRFRPTIASEISPSDLAAAGCTGRQYCEMLTGLGYTVHRLTRRGIGRRIEVIRDDSAFTNVLFVPSQ